MTTCFMSQGIWNSGALLDDLAPSASLPRQPRPWRKVWMAGSHTVSFVAPEPLGRKFVVAGRD